MSRVLSTAVRTGLPFGIAMGVFFGLQRGAARGLVTGVIVGIVFGVAMAAFAAVQRNKFVAMRSEVAPEGLDNDGAANHGRHGGWLFLTPKRLIFLPHRVNVGSDRIEVPRDHIAGIEHRPALGSLRLVVRTTAGQDHTFLVHPRDGWATALPARS